MSDLQTFVLDFCQVNGALIDPPSYGAYEVLLPDDLAAKLNVPALQEIAFDDGEPTAGDGRLHLAQGHPLVDRMVELARQGPALTQAHINAVRLDKRGLAELARQTLSFANARLVELRGQTEAAALYHYLLFTFKVTLATDEKQEQLATVAMHAQAGWPVDWGAIQEQVALDEAPAFAHLAPARPAWLDEPDPFTSAALAGLFARAQRAALATLAGPIGGLSRRAARHLELDRARLEQYYDDLERDLERRLQRAEGDRQATLRDKLASVQAERGLKLADAEARYRLRVDLELVAAQVVTQPKLELQVQIENRNTAIQRRIVWDPLLHAVEPLTCDVCGQPGTSLQLCSGGHLAHAECLLAQQCCDCKRVYCRLCGEEMAACAVCGRPVCRASLNSCPTCGRGTCREHVGLCHAAEGAPATIAAEAKPAVAPPAPKKAKAKEPPKPRPRPAARPAAPHPAAPARPNTANWRLDVEVEWGEPEVSAFVRARKNKTAAVRTWRLSPHGICVACECEKADCPADQLLLRPESSQSIEAQLQARIDSLRQEYGVPARNVSYTLFIHGAPCAEPRLILRGRWKDEETLAAARTGFDAVYAEQHGGLGRPEKAREAPPQAASRPLGPHEVAEAQRFLKAAFGLLKLEGTLKEDELYARVHALLQPGDWCDPAFIGTLLRRNSQGFKVLANGLVATHDVSNVQALATLKRAHHLPPRQWQEEELAAAAEGNQPLSDLEARIQAELRQLTGIDVDVRTIQRALQRGTGPAAVVSSLEHRQGVSDREILGRAAELVDELYRHTRQWELGGWALAELE